MAFSKRCSLCKQDQPSTSFSHNSNSRDGFCLWCKSCEKKKYVATGNSQVLRERWLNRKYGLSPADYEALATAQGNICAICEQPEGIERLGVVLPLSVDHDHGTKQIRALLCGHCNRGLGHFKDNPALLLKAAAYLRSHSVA